MIRKKQEEGRLGQESNKKLLHVKALLIEEKKFVTVLIDTRSLCNILKRGSYSKHGLVVQPCNKKFTRFNGSTSTVMGVVHYVGSGEMEGSCAVLCARRWYSSHNEIPRSQGFETKSKLRLIQSIGRRLCNLVKMEGRSKHKKRKEGGKKQSLIWVHVSLTRGISRV